jgi:hypothetical protein
MNATKHTLGRPRLIGGALAATVALAVGPAIVVGAAAGYHRPATPRTRAVSVPDTNPTGAISSGIEAHGARIAY